MKKIKLINDAISFKEKKSLSNFILKANQFTKGPKNLEFEKKFSDFIGSKYSVFVNSGSSANLLMASALLQSKKLKNKKIIVPCLSWSTTISSFSLLGYELIFCDCNLKNLGLDLEKLQNLIKKYNPGSIIICNVLGHPNDIFKIKKLCKENNIYLLEDNCESLGSKINDKFLGTFGLMSSHSFFFGHHMTTVEGGMISTDDEYLYQLLLSIRSHGWSRDLNPKFKRKLEKKSNIDKFNSLYRIYFEGMNLRSTEINAYLGILQLKRLNSIINKRFKNFEIYKSELKEFWCQYSSCHILSSFAYATFVKNPSDLYENLKKHSIETRPLICGDISSHPAFKKYKHKNNNYNNASFVDKHGIYIPNHPDLKVDEIKNICKLIKKYSEPIFI